MAKRRGKATRQRRPTARVAKAAEPPAPPKKQVVSIAAAKGRPLLTWVGKRPLRDVLAFPAQMVETFDPEGSAGDRRSDLWSRWPDAYPRGGLLFHGDNKEVLAHLLANGFRGKISLVYIDPPFDSGADYVRKVTLRGPQGTAKLGGEGYTLGEQLQYTDIWANDNYLQFMYERLALLRELLGENGSIVIHCDWNVVHLLRCVLDEIFLAQNFVNEIVWQHAVIEVGRGIYRRLPKAHETLLWYVKNDEYVFNPWSKDPRYLRTYVDVAKGKLVHDVWDDIATYRAQGDEHVGFPTQKPEELIARIVALACNPGDLVLDCFVGSGTTLAVAQKLGRRWIGCDINKGAIQTTSKRLQTIIREQVDQAGKAQQGSLEGVPEGADRPSEPAQLSFTVYRVNDYDLSIHHEEAVNLACEHVGVTRMRTDRYFDGTLGRKVVKVVPFSHPLTLLDLDEIKRELDARPSEERGVVLICLGKEPAADAWVEEWNRFRKGKAAANRIEVIELRTDPKYGKFFQHQPARARVKAVRKDDTVTVQIENFISPSIVERLHAEAGLLKPKIEDWRAMVDCVMVDPDYDGTVFRIGLSDVPERKLDLVGGRYEIPAVRKGATVAVKIVDMLGEEVLVTLAPD